MREARAGLFPQVVGDVTAVGTNATNIRLGASGALNQPLILNQAVKWNQHQSINFRFRPDTESYGSRHVSGPVESAAARVGQSAGSAPGG